MNKNSLKQMIVAEMIYADARKLMNESYKKRSLFEMMDDDYLDELDDRKFVHSMKMMLEAEAEPVTVDYGNVGDDDDYEPGSLTTTADDYTDDADDDEIVEPVRPDIDPGENNDSTIITIDGTKYYDGLKYLNKISDEMPAATAESRLSLVDALYA